MQLLLESLFNGVAIGSVLMMAALGLAIVFGLMGVINLAHGELIMLGAYTTYVVQMVFKLPAFQPIYSLYVLVAIPLAFVVSGVVGILLERTVIRRLYGSPLETLLATWGVSLILQQFVRSVPLAHAAGLILSLRKEHSHQQQAPWLYSQVRHHPSSSQVSLHLQNLE